MRQAHPRNQHRKRRAIGPALIAFVVGSLGFLAWGGPGFGKDSGRPDIAGAMPVTSVAVVRPSLPPPAATLPPIVESRSGRPANGRPTVLLPDVEPIVVAGPGPGSKAVFLGDSYTSGWNGTGLGAKGWPALVGAARGWKVVNLAIPGTGFMNPGWTSQPIGSRIDAAARQKPDVVFVAAGHNDSRWSAATTAQAADRAIRRLHAALPDAVIVIVAPIWQDGSPPMRCLVLRDALRRTARAIGAVFIDPLAERWFAGSSHRFIVADGFHPTNAGHRYLADRILADLSGI